MLEKMLRVGPFQSNCYVVACPSTGEALVVDPGDSAEMILAALDKLTPKYLVLTHGHLDHVGAARELKEKFPEAKIALHRQDESLYRQLKTQGNMFGINHYKEPLPVDHFLQDGEKLSVGTLDFTVIHTPGHSPGGLCLLLNENTDKGISAVLYSGDTLFCESVGRTDLWGGSTDALRKSIVEKLLPLGDSIRVCPGHGPETTIGFEKKENLFLNP